MKHPTDTLTAPMHAALIDGLANGGNVDAEPRLGAALVARRLALPTDGPRAGFRLTPAGTDTARRLVATELAGLLPGTTVHAHEDGQPIAGRVDTAIADGWRGTGLWNIWTKILLDPTRGGGYITRFLNGYTPVADGSPRSERISYLLTLARTWLGDADAA